MRQFEWLSGMGHIHAIFVTDSLSTLKKVILGMCYIDWNLPSTASQLESITLIFLFGHAHIQSNERADVLTGSAF